MKKSYKCKVADGMEGIFTAPGDGVSIHHHIKVQIRDAIMTGRLRSDDKLPTEDELAKLLSVHRGTVNRSYASLKSEGLLVGRPGVGTFVCAENGLQERRTPGPRISDMRTVAILRESHEHISLLPSCDAYNHSLIWRGLLAAFDAHDVTARVVFLDEAEGGGGLERLFNVDGVVLYLSSFGHEFFSSDALFTLLNRHVPTVAVMPRPGSPRIPTMTFNRTLGTYLTTQHLIALGHTRIGAFGHAVFDPSVYKFAGYVQAMHEAGLDIFADDVLSSSGNGRDYGQSYADMEQRIRQGDLPTAFVVGTDREALEVIGALTNAGIRVPEDVSIVGYDNIPEGQTFRVPLTTVDSRFFEVGRQAAENLFMWIETQERPGHGVIDPDLIVRGSARPPAVGSDHAAGEGTFYQPSTAALSDK